jgi:hypothetical protein
MSRSGCGFAERIERRRSNVAKNHTEASERQGPEVHPDRILLDIGGCRAESHYDSKMLDRLM